MAATMYHYVHDSIRDRGNLSESRLFGLTEQRIQPVILVGMAWQLGQQELDDLLFRIFVDQASECYRGSRVGYGSWKPLTVTHYTIISFQNSVGSWEHSVQTNSREGCFRSKLQQCISDKSIDNKQKIDQLSTTVGGIICVNTNCSLLGKCNVK